MKRYLPILLSLLCLPVAAQNKPAVAAPAQTVATQTVAADARDCVENIESFIEEKKAALAINGKALDIFGLSQDPKKKMNILPLPKPKEEVIQKTPLTKLLQMMEINMIMPARQSFRIGARSLKVGEELPVTYNNESSVLIVEAVSAEGVIFRNKNTGERARKIVKKLPPGVVRGDEVKHGDGIINLNEINNAPLNLDRTGLGAGDEGNQFSGN